LLNCTGLQLQFHNQLKDNQCKPSNVIRTKNFTQHVVTRAESRNTLNLTGSSEYRKCSPELSVAFPYIARPYLICKSSGYNRKLLYSPTYLLGEEDDHLLRTVEISIYSFGMPRDHIPLCASYS